MDASWEDADIEIEGAPELQQAIRFALFHTVQAGARGEQRLIPAKGLTGPGYDGHTFWDTEAFVLPLLCLTYSRRPAVAEEPVQAADDPIRLRENFSGPVSSQRN